MRYTRTVHVYTRTVHVQYMGMYNLVHVPLAVLPVLHIYIEHHEQNVHVYKMYMHNVQYMAELTHVAQPIAQGMYDSPAVVLSHTVS